METSTSVSSQGRTSAVAERTRAGGANSESALGSNEKETVALSGKGAQESPATKPVHQVKASSAEQVKGAERLIAFSSPSAEPSTGEAAGSASKLQSSMDGSDSSVVVASARPLIVKGPTPRPSAFNPFSVIQALIIVGLIATIILLMVHAMRHPALEGEDISVASGPVMPSEFRMKETAIKPTAAMGLLPTLAAAETSFFERCGGAMSGAVLFVKLIPGKAWELPGRAILSLKKIVGPAGRDASEE